MPNGDRVPGSRATVRVRGFTYVWALALLALTSIGLAAVGPRWSEDEHREREAELIRVGNLYAQAIERYRLASPGSRRHGPARLEDLLSDDRFGGTQRHIRQLYPDPMQPSVPWGLVRDESGDIVAVYSQSERAPLRRVALSLDRLHLPAARRYADWSFVLSPLP